MNVYRHSDVHYKERRYEADGQSPFPPEGGGLLPSFRIIKRINVIAY